MRSSIIYMKYLIIFFVALFPFLSFAQNDSAELQILYKGQLVSVSVEKTLYEIKKYKHFFIHYQIKNLTENNLGVYTDEYFGLFYPNQWGVIPKPARDVIDERRIVPMPLNDSIVTSLERKFINSQLTLIQPFQTLDYYRDFNSGKKKDVQLKSGEFIYISTDGQLFITNGSQIEHAHFDDNSWSESKGCSVFLAYPIVWKKIPENSMIFHED